MTSESSMPPVLLLGGQETALGAARSLGRRGICVLVSGPSGAIASRSRYCAASFPYEHPRHAEAHWNELLLGPDCGRFHGCVLLATSDPAIEFIATRHDALRRHYRLDMPAPILQLALLDKQRTLELGRMAGVAVPEFWEVKDCAGLQHVLPSVRYPVLVKPIHSHHFLQVFGRKYFIADDAAGLVRQAHVALEAGIAFLLCEMIPGPDSLLSSYYTYLTPQGQALFHLTKRILRRFPENEGAASFHVTEWLPQTAAAGARFLRGIGFAGLANVEFKLDRRDGKLKLIECNARFTAAQALIQGAGVDTPWMSYCSALGVALPVARQFREGLYLWNMHADYCAFRELRRAGKLSAAGWLRSIARPKLSPYWSADDAWPALVQACLHLRRGLAKPWPLVKRAYQGWRRRAAETAA